MRSRANRYRSAGLIVLGLLAAQTAIAQPAPQPSAPAPQPSVPPAANSAPASSALGLPPPPPASAAPNIPKRPPPPPPPTPAQLAALAALEKEAAAYAESARDYRSAITRIVQHHYEDRRRRILTALDNELAIEKQGLKEARAEAIRRLEVFVARYSGPNKHEENTPDAMFRLAALYEERARDEGGEDIAASLLPAIMLYKRIVQDFPKYRELAGVYYYLGHALTESNRFPEAQQVWRSLVCHNKFPYPTAADPKDPNKDSITALPQDHDRAYWNEWEARHPVPLGIARMQQEKAVKKSRRPAKEEAKDVTDTFVDETAFVNPFPSTCQPIPQKTTPGTEPRYLAEVWWQIGDYYFNDLDTAGGPFNLNRAESAYRQSILYKKPPVYGVAMYKLAWTYYKQQRYEASIHQFIELLRHIDEQEKLTGDPGTNFRAEAQAYIAGSLTFMDMTGPAADEPYVPRSDILDLENNPKVLEEKMHIAIDRIQDAKLIPQDQKWSVDVYQALAQEYKELGQLHNMVEISEIILKKWPLHRDAPVVQNQVADIYDTLTARSRAGTAERAENAKKALIARTKLAQFVGTTPWVDANKNDPEALETAERLVRGGLKRAAADHTNAGSYFAQQAQGLTDKESRDPIYERALEEYRMAAEGWRGYLAQDENAPDAYESRFWLADAYHNALAIQIAMDRSLEKEEVELSRASAIAVRDSNEDDKYLQPSAYMVVDVAQLELTDQYKRYERSKGANGIELRSEIRFEGEGDKRKVIKDQIPQPVMASIAAREDYILRVPPESDPLKNQDLYAFQAADVFFLYGQFEEARKRFEPIYNAQCGKTEWGYKAWDRLTTMANLDNNIEMSRALAEAVMKKSCAINEEQKLKEQNLAIPTIKRGYYIDAAKAFTEAEKMPEGPERAEAWKKAAALYKVALEKAPAHDEAPEAAMNGAISFKQVGDYDQAIAMYALFIKEYGSDEVLTKLEKGDPSQKPPKPADPDRYGERVKYLKQAYDALSAAYVLFFNYRTAAETYDTVSKIGRFNDEERQDAARNAVLLYASTGDKDKMLSARETLMKLSPSAEQKAEIDFLVVSADLKTWDENAPDEGANRAARVRAGEQMEVYYSINKNNAAAAPFVVQAAYHAAAMRRAGKDSSAGEWCKRTTQAFTMFRNHAQIVEGKNQALGSLQADMAAECAYLALDEQIKAEFDFDTGHHKYEGVIDKIKKNFDEDVKKANDKYWKSLQDIIIAYESRPWSVAARSRQASLYDSCRTGLYNARPPALRLYTDREEKLLKLAETSDREDLQETADVLRQTRREAWRAARERMLNDADAAMVKFYVEAVVWGKTWTIRNAAIDHAVRRLAFFTDILGDAKLREWSQGIVDPVSKQPFEYRDGMFVRSRPGLTPPLENQDGVTLPAPVMP